MKLILFIAILVISLQIILSPLIKQLTQHATTYHTTQQQIIQYCDQYDISHIDTIIHQVLYLGDICGRLNFDQLQTLGIKYVLNCAIESPNEDMGIFLCENLDIKQTDRDISMYLEKGVGFIEKAIREGSPVFVYSYESRHRAPAVVIAYLMKDRGYQYDEALRFVRERRMLVSPREEYRIQVERWVASIQEKK
eukprot:TRINITY_DN6490_c0_g1_i1.p1 TRINITY_DN6490_c0_g1~~TRINITY_DN6490_c0_g1_i1.p1  ORF type:complete len:194 (+),score=23.65 TRINITY_DN6490_c0_g1_i1:1-582(+)